VLHLRTNLPGTLTRDALHKDAALPNNLTIYPTICESNNGYRRLSAGIKINLCKDDSSYLWLEHPKFFNEVDVAAIALTDVSDLDSKELSNINKVISPSDCYETYIAQDVFILGYPLEEKDCSIAGFPIWKRGTIATPPMFNVSNLPKYLIDSATRSGMSGSPVFASFMNSRFRKLTGELTMEATADSFFCSMPKFKFLGIYSSRLGDPKENDTLQLGNVWKTYIIEEIITGNKLYAGC
jgi:hypothetical protein